MSADNNPFKFTVLQKGTKYAKVCLLFEDKEVFSFSEKVDSPSYLKQCIFQLMEMAVWLTNQPDCGNTLHINVNIDGHRTYTINCKNTKIPLVSFYYEKLVKLLKLFKISTKEYKINLSQNKQITFYKFEEIKFSNNKRTAAGAIYRTKNSEQPMEFRTWNIGTSSFTTSLTYVEYLSKHVVTLFLSEHNVILIFRTPKLEKAEKVIEELEKHRPMLLKFYDVKPETLLVL